MFPSVFCLFILWALPNIGHSAGNAIDGLCCISTACLSRPPTRLLQLSRARVWGLLNLGRANFLEHMAGAWGLRLQDRAGPCLSRKCQSSELPRAVFSALTSPRLHRAGAATLDSTP